MRLRKAATIGLAAAALLAACGKRSGEARGATGPTGAAGAGGKGAAAAGRIVPVVVTNVQQRDVPVYLDGLGSVVANKTVTVKSQVDGRLDKVLFREGQEVKRGQLIAQIDPRPFQIQLHQAEGALARDQAQLVNAKKNVERYEALVKKKMIAQQQLDDQIALVGQLEGAVRVDQAAIESAKLNLDYARIASPIDGVTGVRQIDQGNVVRATDQAGLVVLTQLDPIAVLFTLPQDDLPRVAEQMQRGTLLVEAYSRDGQSKLGTGELALIDNQINQATSTMRLKALFPNPQRLLWPNQFVKARLLLTTRKDALVIPSPSVLRGPEGTFAYVIGKDSTASMRPLEVEAMQAEVAIVAKGVQAGEKVVVEGQNQLRPGSKVQAREQQQRSEVAKLRGAQR
jgi:multidrug efflux system membrane fusion protein